MRPMKALIVGTAFLVGGLTVAAGSPGYAQNARMIHKADVVVELEDVNANAMEYYPNIERDLEAKLATEIEPYYSGSGYDIRIRLSEISIDGSALLGNEGEFNTLKGWVYIREQGNPDPVDSVGLSLTAQTGDTSAATESTIVIPPARNAFYEALLQRFAERTVEEVQGL